MKILWVSNIIFPEAAAQLGLKPTALGGWMLAMAAELVRTDHRLAVAALYDGPEMKKLETDGITHYLLPGFGRRARYDACLGPWWCKVLADFKPDIIHIHGTEYAQALPLLEVNRGVPAVVSIQGLMSRYAEEYYGGLTPGRVLRWRTLRDIARGAGMAEGRRQFMRQAASEQLMLKTVTHVIGRTQWDRANTLAINPRLCYHACGETLREPFYRTAWSLDGCRRHTIFMSQATYPIKGLHIMLKALAILKREYPDVRLRVAGRDITDASTVTKHLKRTGYGALIAHMIRIYGLEGHVEFTGMLDAAAMADAMAGAHVFALASAIENSPNSLGEAQLVGTPCVASYVGGVPDMVSDGESGLLFNYFEPAVLALRVARIFNDDALALRLSEGGRAAARTRHDPMHNLETLLDIYRAVSSGGGATVGEG